MALPTSFWRSDHLLNVFRMKPCQRLLQDGCCEWKSQCQYSHNIEWPRRPLRKVRYTPDVCPFIQPVHGPDGEITHVTNLCPARAQCAFSHSKEEVLFHPDILKTVICDENHKNGTHNRTRRVAKNGCHRFYCPFAHGQQEIRVSSLSADQRQRCYDDNVATFPACDCCKICTPHRLRAPPQELSTRAPVSVEPAAGPIMHQAQVPQANGMWVQLAMDANGNMQLVPASPLVHGALPAHEAHRHHPSIATLMSSGGACSPEQGMTQARAAPPCRPMVDPSHDSSPGASTTDVGVYSPSYNSMWSQDFAQLDAQSSVQQDIGYATWFRQMAQGMNSPSQPQHEMPSYSSPLPAVPPFPMPSEQL